MGETQFIAVVELRFRSGMCTQNVNIFEKETVLLIIKASEMHYFSTLFGKELYMFRTHLLSVIRSLNTVFTTTGICRTSYVDCLLPR